MGPVWEIDINSSSRRATQRNRAAEEPSQGIGEGIDQLHFSMSNEDSSEAHRAARRAALSLYEGCGRQSGARQQELAVDPRQWGEPYLDPAAMNSDSLLHQQMPPAYRSLQPQSSHLHHVPPQCSHHPHHTLSSQPDLDLGSLDDHSNVYHGDLHRLQSQSHAHFHPPNGFDHPHGPRHRHVHPQPNGNPDTPQHGPGPQFGPLTPASARLSSISRLQQDEEMYGTPDAGDQSSNGHLPTAIVPDPPNLVEWREKLFNVDEMITLSEDDFQTYFPHVDNVYSHRSTQRYKRKPFVSHYWDCRLKGRPPGTPKSEDPSKKKRKRTARERDLCDVKIKITEYFPGAMFRPDFVPDGPQSPEGGGSGNSFLSSSQPPPLAVQQPFGMLAANNRIPASHPGSTGQRYYTIQRVNGNGGNGKGDGVPGPHKHTLEMSDQVKKSTVQRFIAKRDKEDKKTQKTYHKKATGSALTTVRRHSKEHELKLFGSCFSPWVQRVWIALEAKRMQYQYIEVDPYKKPQALMEVNPRGLVPGIRHGDWGCGESTVLLEYLEDLGLGRPLLAVGDAQVRANCRLWSDHVNRHIVPAFYALLQEQDFDKQAEHTKNLQTQIAKLVDASDDHGPFFLGPHLTFVDVQMAPWMIRCSRVLKHYRGWPDPEPGSRWARWIEAIESNEHVRATTSSDDLYIDSYERYAHNRPGTSELADAINGGYGLP